jgi:hypothetical protein
VGGYAGLALDSLDAENQKVAIVKWIERKSYDRKLLGGRVYLKITTFHGLVLEFWDMFHEDLVHVLA